MSEAAAKSHRSGLSQRVLLLGSLPSLVGLTVGYASSRLGFRAEQDIPCHREPRSTGVSKEPSLRFLTLAVVGS